MQRTNSHNITLSVAALLRGEVIAFPTDTVYGLGVDASNASAVEALYAIKGRVKDQPMQVLVSSVEQALELAEFSPRALRIAQHFWPAGLTLVLPKRTSPLVAENVCGNRETIGLRWPQSETTLALISGMGRPIAASSANKTGEPTLNSAEEILAKLPVSCAIPHTEAFSGKASTVVEVKGDILHIIREGALTLMMLENL